MRAIIFDTELSSLKFDDDVNTIKLCYLIADKICLAGIGGANVTFEKDANKFGITKMLHYLECLENLSDEYDDKAGTLETFNEFYYLIKEMKAVKHPLKATLVSYNLYLKMFNERLKEHVDDTLETWKKNGYYDMIALTEDSIIDVAIPELSIGQWTQSRTDAPLNAKKVLGLLFPESPFTPSLLIFPKEFLFTKIGSEHEIPIDELQIKSVLTFPDISSFSNLQLKAIREQLKELGYLFRKNMDEWLYSFNSTKTTMCANFPISNQFQEAVQLIQSGIDTNQMLIDTQHRLNLDAVTFTIKIGVTSIQRLWDYYRECKVLDGFTIDELIRKTTDNFLFPQCLPFICISPNYINKEQMEQLNKVFENEDSILHKRKVLEW